MDTRTVGLSSADRQHTKSPRRASESSSRTAPSTRSLRTLLLGISAATVLISTPAAAAASSTKDSASPAPTIPSAVVDSDYHSEGKLDPDKVELGRLLFFDKILSGNRNISCATCHHPRHGTSDALALPFGEGPSGLGPDRKPGETTSTAVHGRVPRNSPALFNLGAKEFERLFHDGRVESDPNGYYEGGFITPAKWKLPTGLDNLLAAQAMFPVTSAGEMAGAKGENPVADAASLNNAAGPGGVWELLAERLQEIPEYVDLFKAAFPNVSEASDISFVHAANAIASFEADAFRADDSPFDRYLRGDTKAMGDSARRGMDLFYGEANCSSCHSGKFQTDHSFHAIAMPQIGPGKGDGKHSDYWRETGQQAFVEDFGRGRVTVRAEDNFKFRTPSLRGVAVTGPWGHAGAYESLEAVVRHHLDPVASLEEYRTEASPLVPLDNVLELTASGSRFQHDLMTSGRRNGFLVRDTWVQKHPELRGRIAAANELQPIELSDGRVADLLAFLEALTDPAMVDMQSLEPKRVPSGLPVVD